MSIDLWTLLLQSANVLVLVWLLQRFLFRPVAEAVAQRQKLAIRRLDEARQARDKADALRTGLEAEKAALADSREKVLAEARSAARAEREAILARAAAEAESRLAGAEVQRVELGKQWKAGIESDAGRLAVRITRQLLERFPRKALIPAFVEDSCRLLAALPDDQKQIIDEDIRSGPCKVVAPEFDENLKADCRRRLTQILGGTFEVEFVEQPSLTAGIELRFRRLVVRNSWSNDLERLERLLTDDGRARTSV